MADEFTAKFKVDISDLKKNISEATKEIKLANATFKSETAGMDKWSANADGLSSKLKQLEKVLEGQKSILAAYKQQLERQQQAYTENGKRADELKKKLQELASQGVSKADEEYKKYEAALKSVLKEQANNEKACDDLTLTILEQEAAVKGTEKQIRNYEAELNKLENELDDAGDETDDLADSTKEAGEAAKEAKDGFTIFKGVLANLIAEGIRKATQAIKDFAKETIQVGKDFDTSMSKVGAVSGATAEELEALRNKAKEMGATTKFSASESAEAFNYMAMAGWETGDMLTGIEGILNLAAASGSDLATTSDIVTDALTAMGYAAADAGRLADVMAAASANANTNVEMMGATFQYVAPVAGAMGYSMEDTAVAIGLMANAGIKGTKAGTALRSMLSRLAAPPKEAANAMDALGISITNADGTMKPFSDVIEILRDKFDGLSEAEQANYAKALAGQEAMSGLLAIVNAAPKDFDKLTDAVNNSKGAAAAMAETMQDNLGGDMTKLKSQLEGVQIALYEKLEPALRSGVEALSGLVNVVKWVIDNSEYFIAALAAMGAGVAAYVLYTSAITVMTQGWMALSIVQKAVAAGQAVLNAVMAANPIGLLVAAIAALVAAFVVLWNKSEAFREFWIGLWNGLKNGAKQAWEGIKSVFSGVANWFKDIFSKAWQKVKDVFSTGGKIFEGIKDGIVSAFKAVVNAIIRGINKVVSIPFNAINAVLRRLKGISILGIKPFDWINEFTVPQIPELRRGGVLKRGQVGLLEGDGAEAVVPLDQNKRWIRAVANDLLKALRFDVGSAAGNVSNFAKSNEYNFTQIINAPKAPSRYDIYRQTRNLLAYAKGEG